MLGVLIISLAVAEVLASKLLTELPLLQIVAGLGIFWIISTYLIRAVAPFRAGAEVTGSGCRVIPSAPL